MGVDKMMFRGLGDVKRQTSFCARLTATAICAAIFAVPITVTAQPITNWNDLQGFIDGAVSGAVIDLTALSSPATSRTFTVGNNKTITLRGTANGRLDEVAFAFGSNNNITIENLNIRSNRTLLFTGTGNTLNLMGTNTIVVREHGAAVGVPEGARLTITGSIDAILNATGGSVGGAGIGGGTAEAGGNITITGGTITANGSGGGAGIGGGSCHVNPGSGAGGVIAITGGTITANGGDGGAGIGGGSGFLWSTGASGGTITISGGTVIANGTGQAAGIGSSSNSSAPASNITISGGMVTANGGSNNGAGIGRGANGNAGTVTINGGSINARGGGTALNIDGTLRNNSGQNVFLNTLTVPSRPDASITNVNIGGGTSYGVNGVRTDNNNRLYFYLPASSGAQIVSAAVNSVEYYATPAYTRGTNHNNAQTMILGGDISGAVVSVGSAVYTGSELTPDITVTLGGAILRHDIDYTVDWSGNRTNTTSTDAEVIVTGIGVYTGTAEQSFTIEPKPLTTAMLSIPAVTFNNTAQTPVLTVIDTDLDEELETGVDYTVTLEPQTDAETYAVTVTGIGNYTGMPSVNFVINPRALTDATVTVNGTYTYNGSEHTPTDADIVVTLDGYTPTYDFTTSTNINAGTATVTVTGTGNFGGTAVGTFMILPKQLTPAMVSIPDVMFNGNPQSPVITVVDGEITLVINTDYTFTFTPQTAPGTYPVAIEGTGNYTGTPSVNFIIDPKPLTTAMLSIPAVTFNGSPQTPVLAVVDGTRTLVIDTDYTAVLMPRTDAGTYTITVSGTGSYTGTQPVDFVIAPKLLREAMLSIPAVTFDGTAQTPVLTVVDGTETLVVDADYIAALTSRTDAGTYAITVTGTGNYTGTPSVNFVVNPKALTGTTVTIGGTYIYSGAAQTPTSANLTIALSGYVPTYNIGVTNNTNAGTATVTITGTGNFTGTATGTFIIQSKTLTAEMVSIPSVVFNGGAQTPNLTVADHDIGNLTRDIDFTAAFTPQINADTYPITVTGTGNYTGTHSVNFIINPKALTAAMLSIPAVVFDSTAQIPVLTVTDPIFGALTRNTDFTVTLTPRTDVGTYPIIVTGMGNYTGTPSVDFVINPAVVSVLSPNRIIPVVRPNEEITSNAYVNVLTSQFTAGSNPVLRSSGNVNFFHQGKKIQNATLTIFDASGNVVKKISIKDEAFGTQERRKVGSWDLTDGKGRLMGEGTYLVRGTITDVNGKKERVAVMVGIRN